MSRPGNIYIPLLSSWAVPSVINEICARAGIDPAVNVTDGLDGFLDGFSTTSDHSASSAISALAGIYLFDPSSYDGFLHFIPRGLDAVFNIELDDLIDTGDEIERMSRRDSITIPRVSNLEYYDTEGGLTADKQTSDRSLGDRAISDATTETSVIMRADDAMAAVTIGLKIALEEQGGEVKFALDDSWSWLTVADVGIYLGQRVRITQIEIDEGQQLYTAVYDRQSTYDTTIQGMPISPPSTPPELVVSDSAFEIADIHILSDGNDTLGYYVAVSSLTNDWQGAFVEVSLDGGSTWVASGAVGANAVIGDTTTVLNYHPVDYRDDVNSVTVELLREDMELIAATQSEMQNRANLALIGEELINFSTVDQVGPKTWVLGGLLRGRKGSNLPLFHAAGSRFVLLDSSDIVFVPVELYQLGRSLTFRATSIGADTASATKTITLAGNSQRERQPAYLHAVKSGADLIVSWQGVGRLGGGATIGMGAFFAEYRLTLGSNTYNTTDRTITIPYTAGTLSVRQVNSITGVGPVLSVTV